MNLDARQLEELLAGYVPHNRYQQVSLAQHLMTESPVLGRQREALATVGRDAVDLIAGIVPPQPRSHN